MARIEVRVSDLSGEIVRDEEPVTIEVSHPDFPEVVELDALQSELEGRLPEPVDYVTISYNGNQHLLTVPEFDALFTGTEDAEIVLERATREKLEEQEAARGSTRRRGSQRRQRTNWATAERAGEPHRGTISEAEKAYVREHLDEVNERLRSQGVREIDPADPELAERYGLLQQPAVDAEAGGEAAPRV